MQRMLRKSHVDVIRLTILAVVCAGPFLTACRSDAPLPPVFGAVFGLSGAEVTPFTNGRILEIAVRPGDRLVGAAAANPGSCIWQDKVGRRFRADCPEGSDGLSQQR